jgi:hypothetical protein
LDLLSAAVRPAPRAVDVDIITGIRSPSPLAELCNRLMLPRVAADRHYPFDVDAPIGASPNPAAIEVAQFASAAEERFGRIHRRADNDGRRTSTGS